MNIGHYEYEICLASLDLYPVCSAATIDYVQTCCDPSVMVIATLEQEMIMIYNRLHCVVAGATYGQ